MEIHTLVTDIEYYIQEHGIPKVTLTLPDPDIPRKPTLRLSQMGPKCPRALWYSIYQPELAEPLSPQAQIKYAFGHMIEALGIELAKKSGHTVTGEQDELVVDGIKGHRDCVIDGCVVDVKSTSRLSFHKFQDGSLKDSDSFGYLDQLDGYVVGSMGDPLVTNHERAYILAIEKELGKIALYEHFVRPESIRERIKTYKSIVARSTPPACECGTVPDGESGNIKLDMRASYSPFKHHCFPGLRTFLYAKGPVFLTRVERRPYDPKGKRYIPEIDKNGQTVYH